MSRILNCNTFNHPNNCAESTHDLCKICNACFNENPKEFRLHCDECTNRCPMCAGTCSKCNLDCDIRREDYADNLDSTS